MNIDRGVRIVLSRNRF